MLRLISTKDAFTDVIHNFTYLAYVSPYAYDGVTSASAPVVSVNAIFTSAITGSAKAKALAQDQYGNIKIPLYETLPSESRKGSDWRSISANGGFQWSSLTGLPIHVPPSTGISTFNMETAYMYAICNVSDRDWSEADSRSLEHGYVWSGANFAFAQDVGFSFMPYTFNFLSLDIDDSDPNRNAVLTVANCTVSMRYVEVQISCDGPICQSIAARPSNNPATHKAQNETTSLKTTWYTPLNGLGQSQNKDNINHINYMWFLTDLTNATSPADSCDTAKNFCRLSLIESYLADPVNTVLQTSPTQLWRLGNNVISQRFTQLFNTFWIDSIAAAPLSGNYTLSYDTEILTQ